jgi:hypothetical protein
MLRECRMMRRGEVACPASAQWPRQNAGSETAGGRSSFAWMRHLCRFRQKADKVVGPRAAADAAPDTIYAIYLTLLGMLGPAAYAVAESAVSPIK